MEHCPIALMELTEEIQKEELTDEVLAYFRELDELSEYPSTEEEWHHTWDECKTYCRCFRIMRGADPAGFCFVEEVFPSPFKEPMIYISQFCIANEYRREGAGTEAVRLLIERYPHHVISMRIVTGNLPARQFWNRTLESMRYFRKQDYEVLYPTVSFPETEMWYFAGQDARTPLP